MAAVTARRRTFPGVSGTWCGGALNQEGDACGEPPGQQSARDPCEYAREEKITLCRRGDRRVGVAMPLSTLVGATVESLKR